jgi:tetratricopeptide (TPR) repeat protein
MPADSLFRQAHELGRDPVPGLALLRLAQGKVDSARAMMERALSDPLLSRLDRAKLLPAQAEVAVASGAPDVGRAAADELKSIADAYGSPALDARAAFARGIVDLSDGQPAPAAASLRRAWKLSRDNDLPYEAARARMSLGQAYRACGNEDDAELELRSAAASFERLGAVAAARDTAALLQSYWATRLSRADSRALKLDRYGVRNFAAASLAGLIFTATLGCAHLAQGASVNREATLSRGGGLAGISETITLSSIDGVGRGTWKRTIGGRNEAGSIRLSNAELTRTLQDLDSIARALPASPPDTGTMRQICADYILTRLEARAGNSSHVAMEERPHKTAELESYWRNLHDMFDYLVKTAR